MVDPIQIVHMALPHCPHTLPIAGETSKPSQDLIVQYGVSQAAIKVLRYCSYETSLSPTPVSFWAARPVAEVAVVAPLAPARYKVHFKASAELHDKPQRLRALMRFSVPDGDLGAIIEEAVTEKLERLEAKRLAKTKSPRKSVEQAETPPKSGYIPAPVKRAVRERDGDQCAFADARGRRGTRTSEMMNIGR